MMLKFKESPDIAGQTFRFSRPSLERLKREPAFSGAVRDFIARTVAMYEANPLLNRILSDRGRTIVSLFALYLHYVPPPGETEPGLTLTRLQAMCAATGLCSNGRAAALVSVLRFGGYLVPGVRDHDRRQRVLVPTELFLREQNRRWRTQFEAMTPLFASAPLMVEALDCPDFAAAFLARLGASYLGGFRVAGCVPILADLIESNAALLVMIDLLLRAGSGIPGAEGSCVAVSTSGLARRFGVARAHIRTLLVMAERAGLLRRAREEGQVVVLPALAIAIEDFFGTAFLLSSFCGGKALEDIGLGCPPGPVGSRADPCLRQGKGRP